MDPVSLIYYSTKNIFFTSEFSLLGGQIRNWLVFVCPAQPSITTATGWVVSKCWMNVWVVGS